MKRLQPIEKKAPKAVKPLLGDKHRKKFINALKDDINLQCFLLHQSVYGTNAPFGENGECEICTGDLVHDVFITIHVESTEITALEVEDVEIAEIVVLLDSTIILRNEDGDEWTDDEVSLDDLVNLLNVLDETNRKRREDEKKSK